MDTARHWVANGKLLSYTFPPPFTTFSLFGRIAYARFVDSGAFRAEKVFDRSADHFAPFPFQIKKSGNPASPYDIYLTDFEMRTVPTDIEDPEIEHDWESDFSPEIQAEHDPVSENLGRTRVGTSDRLSRYWFLSAAASCLTLQFGK